MIKILRGCIFLFFIVNLNAQTRIEQVKKERQPIADLGNGTFRNPVLSGKYGDPSVCRVGNDYYMTHSGSGTPCLMVWHSKDLVNWQPIDFAMKDLSEAAWAPDLVFYKGKFYIYVTLVTTVGEGKRNFDNYVFVSDDPHKGWSKPINLNIKGQIDPGHIATPDGKRYLYFDKGNAVELTEDGTVTKGDLKKRYDGWQYPDDWAVECFCLESPKMFKRGDYYYLISAQGGTTGPSTSHMAVVARSKSPLGPWENSPYNPLIHTKNRIERWWSQGHATIIDAPDGSWWAVFHGYENGYKSLGRPTLLLPVHWTADDWLIVTDDAAAILPKTAGENVGHGLPLSDDFKSEKLGLQWRFPNGQAQYQVSNGILTLNAKGEKVGDAAKLSVYAVNHAYEISVGLEISETDKNTEGGLLLYADGQNHVGISMKNDTLSVYGFGNAGRPKVPIGQNKVFLKLRNLNHDLIIYWSIDGKTWKKYPNSYELSQMRSQHLPSLFASGGGEVRFRNFVYLGLD